MSDRLDSLDESKTDWSIRVRVTRMWPSFDVVGQVHNLEPLKIIQTFYGEKLMRKFTIHDGRNYVSVTFWDEDVEILDALVHGNFATPPIVILATMRARVFRGLIQLSSLAHSRVFINIDYEAVNQLRQRLAGEVPGSPNDDM
ncbi:hypothetical protein POM88_042237 [Heracleum sosnowskyi]|uniref:Uncharacterized protein n=1 Tax=Heracleum sosnowskyi TaxID=360622 RepID=A0AAD8MAG8_9APIA|nr:hypothetical protein POM88_042237 [Heracleum sosnowskyi]